MATTDRAISPYRDLILTARELFFRNFPAGSLRIRIATGAFWTILGAGLSQGMGLLATVYCARLLGRAGYGRLGIVLSTINLFAVIGSMGLQVTATKHVAEYRDVDRTRAGRVIGMSRTTSVLFGLVAAAALSYLAPWLSQNSLHDPGLASELRLGSAMMFFAAVNSYQVGTLSGFEAFRTIAILQFIRGVAALPMVIVGVYAGGLWGAVLGYSTAAMVHFIIHEIAINRSCRSLGIRVTYGINRAEARLLFSYSLPVLIAGLSFTPATWWSNAILVRKSGYSEMGLFNAAFQFQAVILFFSNAVSNLGLPMLSASIPDRNIKKYKRLLGINFLLTLVLALAVALPLAAVSSLIMKFYGRQFHGGALVLQLICLATVLMAANISVGQAIWSLNAAFSGMLLSIIRGLALVVGAYLLANKGAAGLAGAWVFMGLVQTAVQAPFMFWLLRRHARRWAITRVPDDDGGQLASCLIQ